MSLTTLIWLFLIAFLLHDLEEIIWVGPWIRQNKTKVLQRVSPKVANRLQSMLRINSSQFGVAVLLELVVFIPFVYIAAEYGHYFMFLAFNTLFLLHVFTHVGQSLYLRMYTPGVVSAVCITLPYGIYLLYRLLSQGIVTWAEVFLSIPVGLVVLPIVMLGHELGRRLVPDT
ncbi:HXXEE domain-containing protein [Paenibacillus illinoisensis]|uniref:HXXEE domain-containing protein n=1 Tax=Paenibacillus illinoisensis TaxID=59845 RepID=UPI0030179D1D